MDPVVDWVLATFLISVFGLASVVGNEMRRLAFFALPSREGLTRTALMRELQEGGAHDTQALLRYLPFTGWVERVSNP